MAFEQKENTGALFDIAAWKKESKGGKKYLSMSFKRQSERTTRKPADEPF